jgi:hypothetical protein
MYYRLLEFYKRDVYFVYSEDKNSIDWTEFRKAKNINTDIPVLYEVDKIDNYISDYDILPVIGAPLVSKKFKEVFKECIGTEMDFLQSIIIDKKGNKNEEFLVLNILNKISCMDTEKSIIEKTKYGTTKIKKLFLTPNSLENKSIVRMEEHNSYIIVTEEFKKRCEEAGLKGIEFIEEGHSIYM